MLRYGMIVKTTKPSQLVISSSWTNIAANLKTVYSSKRGRYEYSYYPSISKTWIPIESIPNKERVYADYYFDIPAGVVGILKYVHVDNEYSIFRVSIPNPVTKKLLSLALEFDVDGININVTEEEKKAIEKEHTKFLIKKSEDNFSAMKRIQKTRDFNLKDQL